MKIKIKRRSISRNIIFVLGNSPRYHGNQLYLNEKKKKKKKKKIKNKKKKKKK